jgi:hypothetical protein
MRIHPSRAAILLVTGVIVAGLIATTAALPSGSSGSAGLLEQAVSAFAVT